MIEEPKALEPPAPLELPPPRCRCRSWLGRPNYHGFGFEPCRRCGGRPPKKPGDTR